MPKIFFQKINKYLWIYEIPSEIPYLNNIDYIMKSIFVVFLCLVSFEVVGQVPELVMDIYPGPGNCMLDNCIAYNGKMIFTGSSMSGHLQLWITDGTSAGTKSLKEFAAWGINQFRFKTLNDKLYFSASDSTHGEELWVTDGTTMGTQMVRDIRPGGWGSLYGYINPSGVNKFATLGGKLYFVANDSLHGSELWVSDGTTSGTMMVIDINLAATIGGAQGEVVSANGKLYFPADDGVHGMELWTSDGTAAGSHMVKDLDVVGNDTSMIRNLIVFYGKIYFTEYMSYPSLPMYTRPPSKNFCVTDGTAGGTIILDTALTNICDYAELGRKLYFAGNGGLWVTDGTAGGTHAVLTSLNSICTPGASTLFFPNSITAFNNKLYFYNGGPTSAFQSQIWVSDGTSGATRKLRVPDSNTSSDVVAYHLTKTNNYLFFVGWDNATNQWNLWKSDGTLAGTGIVPYSGTNTYNKFAGCGVGVGFPTLVDSTLYFGNEYDTLIGFELYKLAVKINLPDTAHVANNLGIYPNPTKNTITIAASYTITSVAISNILGQIVYRDEFNADKVQVNVINLPPGVYHIRINNTEVRRFVKL